MINTEKTTPAADATKASSVAVNHVALKAPAAPAVPVAPAKVARKAPAKRVIKPSAVASKPAVTVPTKAPAKAPIKSAAVKAAPKAAAKPVVKAAVAAKAPVKAVAKPAVKTLVKAAVKALPKGKAKMVKVAKEKKPKLVRDSFTIPKPEYIVLDELKHRAGKLSRQIKKSELIRAGIKALAAMSDPAFLGALKLVPTIKTGRPTKV